MTIGTLLVYVYIRVKFFFFQNIFAPAPRVGSNRSKGWIQQIHGLDPPDPRVGSTRSKGWIHQIQGLDPTDPRVGSSRSKGWIQQIPGLDPTDPRVGSCRPVSVPGVYGVIVKH